MKRRRTKWKTVSTDQVAAFIETLDELEWTDWQEISPGRWHPHPDAYEKIQRLRVIAERHLLEIDQDERRIEEEQAPVETWATPSLTPRPKEAT